MAGTDSDWQVGLQPYSLYDYLLTLSDNRMATPSQIGGFIAVLLSDKQGGSGYLAGSDVTVDGGYTIY